MTAVTLDDFRAYLRGDELDEWEINRLNNASLTWRT